MKRGVIGVAVIAALIAAWPFLGAQRAGAAHVYVAPVLPDYQYRDRTVAFYERRIKADPQDQISAKFLGAQYMQRYRETQDVGDILRAIAQEQRSLKLQPQNNAGRLLDCGDGIYRPAFVPQGAGL